MREPIVDPDLGWHLKGGEHVWRHGWPSTQDEFSYTLQGRPWIAYSWLAELAFWLLSDRIGFHALILFCAAIAAAAFVVVYLTARDVGASCPAAFSATLLGAIATTIAMTQRPGIASYLLAAVFWRAIVRHRSGLPVRLWVLVPLMALWANVHVFLVFGLAWLWAAALWEVAERVVGRADGMSRHRWSLTLTAVGCTAAVLVNPYGLRLMEHVIEIATQPSALPAIMEFASPDFHGPGLVVMPLLLALIAALAWARARPDPYGLALVLAHTALALYMRRNIPFLAIVAVPMLALAATQALGAADSARPSPGRLRAQILFVLALAALVVRTIPRQAGFEANLRPGAFPVGAVEFLKAQPPIGRMMNTFTWGGFLIYTLHPRYRVSIDGRGGVYGEAYIRDYLHAESGSEGWQASVQRLAPDFVLCERGGPLAMLLAENPRWINVYADEVAMIFVRADHPDAGRLSRAGGGWNAAPAARGLPPGPAAAAPTGVGR